MAGDNSRFATCNIFGMRNVAPDGGSFNTLIRGDSAQATVRVTANWIGVDGWGKRIECVTSDVWEREFEKAIKAKAESH